MIQVVNVPAHSPTEKVFYIIPSGSNVMDEIMAVVHSYQRYGYYIDNIHCKGVEITNGYKRKRVITIDK